MPTTIKYIGTADNYAELAITGKQSVWQVGQQEERTDAEAALLLSTGMFSTPSKPVTATTNLTGGIDFVIGGKSAGAKLGAAQVTYDTSGRVATHDGWTLSYDSSGRVSSQTNGTQTQTFNYDSSGRFSGITES